MESIEIVSDSTSGWAEAAAASSAREERAAQLAMPPRRFDEMLPCGLTDDELRERADELVKVLGTVDSIKVEKKATVDQFKARIQIQEERARELRQAISTKREDRSVECVESFELRLGVARTTRTDTGEQIRERALRQSELQPTLPAVDDSPQMSLDEAPVDDDAPEPAVSDEDVCADSDGATIDDPEAVLASAPESDEPAKPRRGRRARA